MRLLIRTNDNGKDKCTKNKKSSFILHEREKIEELRKHFDQQKNHQ